MIATARLAELVAIGAQVELWLKVYTCIALRWLAVNALILTYFVASQLPAGVSVSGSMECGYSERYGHMHD